MKYQKKQSEMLTIAKEVSGNNWCVMRKIRACIKDTEQYYEKHMDIFEKRNIHEFFDEEPEELQWIALVEVLCAYDYAFECSRMEELESFVKKLNGLRKMKRKKLIAEMQWFEQSETIESWIQTVHDKWLTQGIGLRTIRIDADCYILVPYEVSNSSCFMSVEKEHGKVQILNDSETVNIMEYIDSVVVCVGEKQQKYEKVVLTEKSIWKLLDEVLSGVWNRLEIEFSIQEEEYVERLDKYVSRRRPETLVIFSEKEGMALLYFCRKELECYKLISHCIPSKEVEIPVGNTKLLRCILHNDRRAIDNGVVQIFRNIENVYEALKHTEEWCAEYPKGKNGFNKICRKYGVAEEICRS